MAIKDKITEQAEQQQAPRGPGRPPKRKEVPRRPGRPPKEAQMPSVIHIKLPESQYKSLLYLRDELKIANTTSELVRLAVDNLIVEMTRKHGSLERTPAGRKLDPNQQLVAALQQMLLEAQIWVGEKASWISGELDAVWRSLRDALYANPDWRVLNVRDAYRTLNLLMERISADTELGMTIRKRLEPLLTDVQRLLLQIEPGGEDE